MVLTVGSLITSGIVAMLRLAINAKTRRSDQMTVVLEAHEALDVIGRLVNRAVDWRGGFSPFGGGTPMSLFRTPRDWKGIHFLADIDDSSDPATEYGYLDWVWIWCDRSKIADQVDYPYDRRYQLKVAAFRVYPRNWNTADGWTRESDAFYEWVNHDTAPSNSPPAYLQVAANFSQIEFDMDSAADQDNIPRVRLRGGMFVDRTATDPAWSFVSPGSPGRWDAPPPSHTFSAVFCPRSYNSDRPPTGLTLWRGNTSAVANRNAIRVTEVNYRASITGNPFESHHFLGR